MDKKNVEARKDDVQPETVLVHHAPGTYPSDRIEAFLRMVHGEYANGRAFRYDPQTYAEKIGTLAEVIVAESAGNIVGGLFGYCNDSETKTAYISYIGRTKNSEKGLGTRMHALFEDEARNMGMERIRLEVRKGNVHARDFYQRLGYVIYEELENSLLLEKILQ